jgi:hypothetical protein
MAGSHWDLRPYGRQKLRKPAMNCADSDTPGMSTARRYYTRRQLMNEFLNFVIYFSEGIVRIEPLPFFARS